MGTFVQVDDIAMISQVEDNVYIGMIQFNDIHIYTVLVEDGVNIICDFG